MAHSSDIRKNRIVEVVAAVNVVALTITAYFVYGKIMDLGGGSLVAATVLTALASLGAMFGVLTKEGWRWKA